MLTAYELALRARAHAFDGIEKADRAAIDQAIREAREALAVDPNSVLALNVLAIAYGNALQLQMVSDREQVLQETMWAATRAIELDGTNSFGYALRALCIVHSGQLDRYHSALADARRANEMNPHDTIVLRTLGQLEATAGETERAIEHLHQVLRLNPRQSRQHLKATSRSLSRTASRRSATR
jgi:tetratricopeptide (TPR) repeat protein